LRKAKQAAQLDPDVQLSPQRPAEEEPPKVEEALTSS